MVTAKRRGAEIEVQTLDDLVRLLKEGAGEDAPLTIRADDGEEFVVRPASRPRPRRRPRDARAEDAEAAFLSAFGSWRDHIDPDEFMRQVRAGRGSDRPLVVLDLPEE